MLRYLGGGPRPYGDHPIPSHQRMNWEFQAVLRGKIYPSLEDRDTGKAIANTFWLFPPGKSHGWTGEKGNKCEIFVAHFSEVPSPIESLAEAHGYLKIHLDAAKRERLARYAKTLYSHYWQPTFGSDVYTQRILMELCLMFLVAYPETSNRQKLGSGFTKVTAAEDWLRAKILNSPKISEAARHVGLSVSQLNRLFMKIRGEKPKQFLVRSKIARAMRLLARGNTKLEAVADQSGFSSASNFCRTFRALKGVSPTKWRQETMIRYRTPADSHHNDPASHGRIDHRRL